MKATSEALHGWNEAGSAEAPVTRKAALVPLLHVRSPPWLGGMG